jgi:hypothetical protein
VKGLELLERGIAALEEWSKVPAGLGQGQEEEARNEPELPAQQHEPEELPQNLSRQAVGGLHVIDHKDDGSAKARLEQSSRHRVHEPRMVELDAERMA